MTTNQDESKAAQTACLCEAQGSTQNSQGTQGSAQSSQGTQGDDPRAAYMAAQVVVVSLIIVIGLLAVAGSVSPVEAIVSIGLLLRFTQILVDIGMLASAFETRRPVLDLSHEVLSAPELPILPSSSNQDPTSSNHDPASSDQDPACSGSAVALTDVSFAYEADHPVLRGVSFQVAPGTMTAIVGPSGCGKTTIARLVARFYDVDAGSVSVGGRDVRSEERRVGKECRG